MSAILLVDGDLRSRKVSSCTVGGAVGEPFFRHGVDFCPDIGRKRTGGDVFFMTVHVVGVAAVRGGFELVAR